MAKSSNGLVALLFLGGSLILPDSLPSQLLSSFSHGSPSHLFYSLSLPRSRLLWSLSRGLLLFLTVSISTIALLLVKFSHRGKTDRFLLLSICSRVSTVSSPFELKPV